jgi:hypothetical protein
VQTQAIKEGGHASMRIKMAVDHVVRAGIDPTRTHVAIDMGTGRKSSTYGVNYFPTVTASRARNMDSYSYTHSPTNLVYFRMAC